MPPSDVGNENNHMELQLPVILRRSIQERKLTQMALESMEQGDLQFNIAYSAQYYEAMHESDYQMQELFQDPIAFKAPSNPNTLYYHQTMAAPDREEFRVSIMTEVNGHIDNNH
eukprot:11583356-Ditylum_brightwellii.AAC.1